MDNQKKGKSKGEDKKLHIDHGKVIVCDPTNIDEDDTNIVVKNVKEGTWNIHLNFNDDGMYSNIWICNNKYDYLSPEEIDEHVGEVTVDEGELSFIYNNKTNDVIFDVGDVNGDFDVYVKNNPTGDKIIAIRVDLIGESDSSVSSS